MAKIELTKPSLIDGGLQKISYPVDQYDLRTEITKLVVEKGFTKEPVPLEELHNHLSPKVMAINEHGINQITRNFYETSEKFQEIYHSLIKHIVDHISTDDFLFQDVPTIRFHHPVAFSDIRRTENGSQLNFHTDSMLGHPLDEINCWLPLTKCYGNSALQIATLEQGITSLTRLAEDCDYDAESFYTMGHEPIFKLMTADAEYLKFILDACKPAPMDYGELLLFDPRCIHGTAENNENDTRVSLDFRLIPVDAYNNLGRVHKSGGSSNYTFTRGDVYAAKSVREM